MAATLESIVCRVGSNNPEANLDLIRRAHAFAQEKHEGQLRRTGEPYIQHPTEVADILASLQMDDPSVAAGFLHDVIEDCGVSRDQLAELFGEEIADLVDGVTKLKLADFERRDDTAKDAETTERPELAARRERNEQRRKKRLETRKSAENLRKILLAMARDFRVMVIKIADRLHNMRTLGGLPPERQVRVAEETMQIFAPLAHRLGIWQVKWQLEDLAFKYLYPASYKEVTEKIVKTRQDREEDIREAVTTLRDGFAKAGLDPEIQGRPKHLWSIYNKMQKQEIDFSDIYDLIALRVITNSVGECYTALGVVHEVYLPIPGKFDDYIAKKKSNLYQSLHTKVYGPRGEPLEIQIRTWEMHRIAEFGVAAHWAYKEGGEAARASADFDRKMAFLRQQLFDWQLEKDSSSFLNSVVSDLFTDQVFVFTPKGDVIDLPADATPIDFAYRIHSDLGEHAAAAKVNGKIVPLSYRFKNGDICSIVSRPNANPSLDWLNLVKSSHARTKIKGYFRKQHYAENVIKGREMIHEELLRHNLPTDGLRDRERMTELATALNKDTPDDLYAAVGFGDVPLGVVVNRLRPEKEPEKETDEETANRAGRKPTGSGKLAIAPGGVDDVMVSRARCCLPLPGDEVVGYVSRGKGMLLHRDGCPNVVHWRETEPDRLIAVDWAAEDTQRFDTGIIFETVDRFGLVRDVSEIFAENKTFILGIHTRSNKQGGTAILRIDFEAESVERVGALIRKLQSVEDLIWVHRVGVGTDEAPHPSAKP